MAENVPVSDLTPAQLTELTDQLASKRGEVAERLALLERDMLVKDDCSLADAADVGSLQESRLRARGIAEQHRLIIKEIDAALQRLENRTYGISETTGDPISYHRLRLVPRGRTDTEDKVTDE